MSVFRNRWGLGFFRGQNNQDPATDSPAEPVQEEVIDDNLVDENLREQPDSKSTKKKKKEKRKHKKDKHKRRNADPLPSYEEDPQENAGNSSNGAIEDENEVSDVEAAVMNLVARTLTEVQNEDSSGAERPVEDPGFGGNATINHDDDDDDNNNTNKKRKHDQLNVTASEINNYLLENDTSHNWQNYINEEPQPHIEEGEYRKSKKKKKTSQNQVSTDPLLAQMAADHRQYGSEQALLQEAVREATEIARSLASGEATTTTTDSIPSSSSEKSKKRKHRKKDHESPQQPRPVENTERSLPPRMGEFDDDRTPWNGKGSELGGSFTTEEEAAIANFIKRYKDTHDLSEEDIRHRVWTNYRVKDDFWTSLSEVLPDRTRASVYKHVRRQYHIFAARGKWTPEEDRQLDHLYKEFGAQWKTIGIEMGRMPEDCRDRWRNYVKCGPNRAQNRWTEDEENQLRAIVSELMLNDPGVEINWTVVSERMDGRRSRIQCRYKWNNLSKKLKTTKAEAMYPGDHIAMVMFIKNAGISQESEIDWHKLSELEGQGIWTAKDFEDAFGRLRMQVPGWTAKSFHEIVSIMEQKLRAAGNTTRRTDLPPGHPQAVVAPDAIKSQSEGKKAGKKSEDGYVESWTMKG
ncbi:hypothetical protein TRVA0_002S05336 [Trichomonascus vanleenenianus]|uniref:uncharacterized protein n=1 Tax=Trichomonascus vanleenenianus TaxID=2268995 RepID=UPI003ECB2A52